MAVRNELILKFRGSVKSEICSLWSDRLQEIVNVKGSEDESNYKQAYCCGNKTNPCPKTSR
jgi:hypothetical protein